MKRESTLILISLMAAGTWLSMPAFAQDAGTLEEGTAARVHHDKPHYSPYAGRNFPRQPFFGDTHLHTSYSLDAGAFGLKIDPAGAYRFAKGEEMTTATGLQARLSRPLDFLVVADHSDNLGFIADLYAGNPKLLAVPQGRTWYDMIQDGQGGKVAMEIVSQFANGTFPKDLMYAPGTPAYRSAWENIVKAAEEANEPGRFTAFIGYEWTSMAANNNHRNVIYRNGGDMALRMEPFTIIEPQGSPRERDLWDWMARYEEKTGGDVLAIPHNGNVSNGRMFPFIQPFTDDPIDQKYVETRARWEPIYEATQAKGDGEAHPLLSPNDEFADYETWDKGNLDVSVPKEPEMLEHEYARSGLKLGLKLEDEYGVNPFKIGLIGSTDSHIALSTAAEDNFFGKTPGLEPSPERLQEVFAKSPDGERIVLGWETTASGYAAVWAMENTRESLFDAMERREVYATTGSRMIVRLFGGWDFETDDADTRSPAFVGYRKGVPMGGDLRTAPDGKVPTFLVVALKDPIGANLDRYQIVKGWLDADGELQERVYDVAVSDGRAIGEDGRCRTAVGNTVDVADANWTNTIGDPELLAVWEDPDFDPTERAFYYGRVIEIPTPRWTAYDAKYYGLEDVDPEIPMTTQERAYTSPIWYTP